MTYQIHDYNGIFLSCTAAKILRVSKVIPIICHRNGSINLFVEGIKLWGIKMHFYFVFVKVKYVHDKKLNLCFLAKMQCFSASKTPVKSLSDRRLFLFITVLRQTFCADMVLEHD